jgi:hypothetical protein
MVLLSEKGLLTIEKLDEWQKGLLRGSLKAGLGLCSGGRKKTADKRDTRACS